MQSRYQRLASSNEPRLITVHSLLGEYFKHYEHFGIEKYFILDNSIDASTAFSGSSFFVTVNFYRDGGR